MNRVLLRAEEIDSAGKVTLSDRRFKHLTEVLNVEVAQAIRVGIIDGGTGSGTVLAVAEEHLELQVVINEPPSSSHPLTPVIALPRPKMLRRIFRLCAEFGAEEIHLINSYRVEKSFWQSPQLDDSAMRSALLEGLERSGGTRLPRVHLHKRFKPFVEDQLPALAAERPVWLAHPGSKPPMPTDLTSPGLIFIGPEGGFIPYEVALLSAQGAEAVGLGARILSVDTAVATVLGRNLVW
jgi:16S rRNA (uracil1498-N3)-methyltransferase